MILNRPAIITTILILTIGTIGYILASNEKAYEDCRAQNRSHDVCSYTLK